ncbi:MAG: M48 family metallopeptidase [Bacteroidales bacterium]|nr:M48 family metallopeptidase [Bacteroidales bacterium]
MKRLALNALAIVLCCFFAGPSTAQQNYDLDHFDGLHSEGPMPADLRMSLDELYASDKQRVRDYNDGKLRNRDKILRASYQLTRTIASGRILFGDPITRMVERIADTLLKDYPTLRDELRFYTIKSPDVNAFATGQGMIFVCTGLIAQVEDEAQLAFVISHEIVHYLRKHSIEEISRRKRDSDDIEAETQEMRDFIKYHNRSREMESEADSIGIAMFFLPSPYDKGVMNGVFDVLQYGYLPFDEVPFDTAFFNTPYYSMSSDYFMRQVDPITARDDYNDSLSTHPNILKRRNATSRIIGNNNGGHRFVTVTEQEFMKIRDLARFECVRQNLIYAEYVRAFYDSFLLLRDHPDNLFVNRALCQALYGLSKFKTYTNTSKAVGDYKDFEGEVQQCYYFFRRIKNDDMALITARHLWKCLLRFPNDRQIADMTADIFADLHSQYQMDTAFFSATPPRQQQADTAGTANLSKYERLKRKKKQQKEDDVHAYAFTDLMQDGDALTRYMSEHLKKTEQPKTSASSPKNQLVYCPTYYVVSKQSGELNIKQSNANEYVLNNHIRDAAARNGIGSVDFSDQSLHDMTSAERYNEWVDLNEWVGEFWQTKGDFDMHLSMQPKMNALAAHYDASSVNMSVVLNRENLTNRGADFYAWWIWVLPVTPLIINKIVAHSEATMVYSLQIDLGEGAHQSKTVHLYELKDEPARVRSSLYDHFLNIDFDTLTKTPGYMGSRFNVALSPNTGFRVIGLLAAAFSSLTGNEVDEAGSPFSLGADAELAYIVNRSSSLQLRAGFMATSYYDDVNNDKRHAMNQFSLSLGWRCYQDLAPLGYYWQLGADLPMLKLKEAPAGLKESYSTFGLHLELGRNHIFRDHILFGYYVRYTIIPAYLGDVFPLNGGYRSSALSANFFRMGINIGLVP